MKTKLTSTPWLIRISLIICIVFLIFEIIQIIRYAFLPNQMDFGEGFTMYIAKLWANGQFQWNPSSQPYMTLIYGVIYPTLLKPFVLLFGPDLRIGRIYCLIASVIIGIFIYLIARKFSKDKYIPLIAALLPLLHPGYREWIMQARCDMVAIMFSVIGVYLAILWQSNKKMLWSIPLFLLAFFTKQTAVMGAIVICFYLLIVNRKLFIVYAAILLISVIMIILLGNALTDGQFFRQLWEYNRTIPIFWSSNAMERNFQDVFNPLAFILLGAAVIVLFKPYIYKQYSIPLLWISVSLIITCGLLGRKGAFINYGMELIIVAGLCFALLLQHVGKISPVILGVLIPAQVLLCFSVNPVEMPDQSYMIKVAQVKEIVKNTQQPILTENAGLVLGSGKTPYYEPFVYTNLEQLGFFDENIILNDLNNQRMDFLVLKAPPSKDNLDHFNERVIEAINHNYRIIYCTYNGSYWYDFCVYESNSLYNEQQKLNSLVSQH